MSIKILIDGKIFSTYPFGGIARYFREILPRIAERNKDIWIYILCHEDAKSLLPSHARIFPLYFHSWNFRPYSIASRLNAWRKQRFDRQIKEFNPQIFHSTYYTFNPSTKGKTIATVYDLIAYEYPYMISNGSEFAAHQSSVLSQADHVISISKSTTELAVSAFKLEMERITTVHLDASPVFRPVSTTVKKQFKDQYSQGRPFFLFVGATSSYKNLATLIRAFGLVSDRTNHMLLLAGHSLKKLDQWYFDLAIQYKVENRIVILAHPDDDLLCQAYNAADAFVFPTLQEGFGIPLLEAMRCGTPVIASDIPVFHEICGETALFFDPHNHAQLAEQLVAVVEPTRQRIMSLAAMERAKLFSWDVAAENIEDVYLKVSSEE